MLEIVVNKKPPLTTLDKGLQVLEFIVREERLVRLKDVADAFSMDQSTALRFLKTLQYAGFIQRYEELKAYSPGPKLAELYHPKPSLEMLVARTEPLLVRLAEETGQSAHLGVLEGDNAILAGVAQSPGRIVVKQAVGDLESLYISAVGKVLFAYQTDTVRRSLGQRIRFKRYTATTIPDLQTLELEAEHIRLSGVGFDKQEASEEISCIACPIFDINGKIAFSIGISMVAGLLVGSVTDQHDLISSTKVIAREITATCFSNE